MHDRRDSLVTRLTAYWDGFLVTEPLFATAIGDRRFDDMMSLPDEDGRAAREALHAGLLADVRDVDRAGLERESRLSLLIAESLARRELAHLRNGMDELWAMSHMLCGHRYGPGLLLGEIASVQRLTSPHDRARHLARLGRVPEHLDAQAANVRAAVARRRTAARPVLTRTIGQIERILETPAAESAVVSPLLQLDAVAAEQARTEVESEVYPAYERLLAELRIAATRAVEDLGLCGRPDGDRVYRDEIHGWCSAPADPIELHEYGRERLEAVLAEQLVSARRMGCATVGAARAASAELTATTRDAVLAAARERVEEAWDELPAWFGRLPQRTCAVEPVASDIETDVLDYYKLGNEARPGIFFVNTRPPRSLHGLPATAYHEANPGHHLQMALDVEAGGRLPIRRCAGELQGIAYCEGWALYSERLADEMGLYRSEAERMGMLELQALRTARLVVDTGMHELGWTRDEVLRVLRSTGFKPEWCESETDRYSALPAQALAYAVGQREVQSQRHEWTKAGGRLRDFHDAFLELGAVPLEAIEPELARTAVRPS